MGMVGQLYVRPRQNRVNGLLRTALTDLELRSTASPTTAEYERLRKRCGSDILCATPLPARQQRASNNGTQKYAYNDGDGSTAYDVEYPHPDARLRSELPLRRHDLQPGELRRHEGQVLPAERPQLPGHGHAGCHCRRRRPTAPLHASQPLPSVINIPAGGKALLRISDLNVTEYHTLASLGIPMHVIALNARLLRDQDGNNMYYDTNSITLGGGESLDVILDATGYHGGPEVLPLHAAARPPVERRRELRRHDDRGQHLHVRRSDHQGRNRLPEHLGDRTCTPRRPTNRC